MSGEGAAGDGHAEGECHGGREKELQGGWLSNCGWRRASLGTGEGEGGRPTGEGRGQVPGTESAGRGHEPRPDLYRLVQSGSAGREEGGDIDHPATVYEQRYVERGPEHLRVDCQEQDVPERQSAQGQHREYLLQEEGLQQGRQILPDGAGSSAQYPEEDPSPGHEQHRGGIHHARKLRRGTGHLRTLQQRGTGPRLGTQLG